MNTPSPETTTMPLFPIIALFAGALVLIAAGSPLGMIFLVLGAILLSLKIGMPVVRQGPLPGEIIHADTDRRGARRG